MHRYAVEDRIGEGGFGTVTRARFIETGEMVAIKKITPQQRGCEGTIPNNTLREVKALQRLQLAHPNVIKLFDVFPHGGGIALVTELLETDLDAVLKDRKRPLSEAEVKGYLVQLLRGLMHIHNHNLMHRDIKPSNLLLSKTGLLKIGDFGLARVWLNDGRQLTHEVTTKWYRAPELLFGSRQYTPAIDLWAAGCSFGEMLSGMALFPGDGEIDQLGKIWSVLGTPGEDSGMSGLPDWEKIKFPPSSGIGLHKLIPNASPGALSLLQKFLLVNPKHRITAEEALLDSYFTQEPLPFELRLSCPQPSSKNTTRKTKKKLGGGAPAGFKDFIEGPFEWNLSPPSTPPSHRDANAVLFGDQVASDGGGQEETDQEETDGEA
eukprot:TRINITY_DN75635_c0_g1_i1.p1 TRINITY_DN75635_c0_g1~~TRINITY_DN75635_c0_g1_i1.p1  ORF type:complete len:378 (-),score=39.77 TRINITY_DN75635_c0_g1_i1:35-1168(-)